MVVLVRRGGRTVRFGEPVQEHDADGERQLLAGDRIGDALEHRWEPGWLQAAKAVRQGAKVRIVRDAAVEIIELYIEAEQSAERGGDRGLEVLPGRPARPSRPRRRAWALSGEPVCRTAISATAPTPARLITRRYEVPSQRSTRLAGRRRRAHTVRSRRNGGRGSRVKQVGMAASNSTGDRKSTRPCRSRRH